MELADRTWPLDALTLAIDSSVDRGGATFEVAGLGARFVAGLIDCCILLPYAVGCFFLLIEHRPEYAGGWRLALCASAFGAANLGYCMFFELATRGQTIGKSASGLRVISSDGRVAAASQLISRNLLRLADWAPAAYAAGLISSLCSASAQRVGDRLAGTIVVHDNNLRQTLASIGVPASVYSTSDDGYLLEAFLSRAGEIPPVIAEPMAQRIAQYFHGKYLPAEDHLIACFERSDFLGYLRSLYEAEKSEN